MSENKQNTQVLNSQQNAPTIPDFKKACFRVGVVMSIFFFSASLCSFIMGIIYKKAPDNANETFMYVLRLFMSALFLYIIPTISGFFIFKSEDNKAKKFYKKPPRMLKAIGNLPSMYGVAQIVNITALLVAFIFSKITEGSSLTPENVERSLGTMDSLIPPNIFCGIILLLYMTVMAGFFEELLCRGLLLNELKPFGNGFAIIVTAFIFGIMHGNFQQFFYAFALGIILGYITIQTGSILSSTILHALFNSISGVMMLFLSIDSIKARFFLVKGMDKDLVDDTNGDMAAALFGIYFVAVLIFLIIGVVLGIKRIAAIKKYKVDNSFTEISTKEKTVIFLKSAPIIIMLILTVDRFAGGFVISKLLEVI